MFLKLVSHNSRFELEQIVFLLSFILKMIKTSWGFFFINF